ncbi:hypothetical protein Ciccas_012089 [Cichlidogyrus casuarinus]|uniref:Uncharacterized protein n=1 Tax=Cichlidogyrus casuarinus TaxID=1844966 RepID=A0ABD2PPD2_9PLAT
MRTCKSDFDLLHEDNWSFIDDANCKLDLSRQVVSEEIGKTLKQLLKKVTEKESNNLPAMKNSIDTYECTLKTKLGYDASYSYDEMERLQTQLDNVKARMLNSRTPSQILALEQELQEMEKSIAPSLTRVSSLTCGDLGFQLQSLQAALNAAKNGEPIERIRERISKSSELALSEETPFDTLHSQGRAILEQLKHLDSQLDANLNGSNFSSGALDPDRLQELQDFAQKLGDEVSIAMWPVSSSIFFPAQAHEVDRGVATWRAQIKQMPGAEDCAELSKLFDTVVASLVRSKTRVDLVKNKSKKHVEASQNYTHSLNQVNSDLDKLKTHPLLNLTSANISDSPS